MSKPHISNGVKIKITKVTKLLQNILAKNGVAKAEAKILAEH
jgi:hypothetical protein